MPDSPVGLSSTSPELAEILTWPECPDCEGSGEITWNPSRHNDPQWEQSARCSRCGGHGAINQEEARNFYEIPSPSEERAGHNGEPPC